MRATHTHGATAEMGSAATHTHGTTTKMGATATATAKVRATTAKTTAAATEVTAATASAASAAKMSAATAEAAASRVSSRRQTKGYGYRGRACRDFPHGTPRQGQMRLANARSPGPFQRDAAMHTCALRAYMNMCAIHQPRQSLTA
jgi:hypothetical protein